MSLLEFDLSYLNHIPFESRYLFLTIGTCHVKKHVASTNSFIYIRQATYITLINTY